MRGYDFMRVKPMKGKGMKEFERFELERNNLVDKLSYEPSDRTILLEEYKKFGKDINVVNWYHSFLQRVTSKKASKKEVNDFKERFKAALGDLKYMGIVSESGRGTFIFKRNYFGKTREFGMI